MAGVYRLFIDGQWTNSADSETFPARNSAWITVQVPFGGVKDGGFGRERGEQRVLDFTISKNVMTFSQTRRRSVLQSRPRRLLGP